MPHRSYWSASSYAYLLTEAYSLIIDIKLDNILVGFEDPSVIEDFARAQAQNPVARKIQDGRSVYQSHNDFGPLKSFLILPKIADFAWPNGSWTSPKDTQYNRIITAHLK